VADVMLSGALSPVQATATPQAATIGADALRRHAGVYVQPRTMEVIELSVRTGALIMGRQAGPALIPVSENRFRTAGRPIEVVFANGDHAGFEITTPGVHPVGYEWRQPVAFTKATLRAFEGRYVSDELWSAIYRVTATDTTLELKTGTSDPLSARPVFANTFLAGGYTIQFKDANPTASGFEITDGRMRRVKFVRLR
jgi:hypothetical protein